jgi:prepilin-type N-terminal cleavage/methylation domain-containing protein
MALRRSVPASSFTRRGITLLEMLIVVVLISLLAAITFPSVTSGLDSIRLRSASDNAAAFLAQAATRADRRQEPVEITLSKATNTLSMRSLRPGLEKEVTLPDGISLVSVLPEPEGDTQEERSFLLLPGAAFPRITLVLGNRRGQKRAVQLDPVTGVPVVGPPESVPGEGAPQS